MTILGHRFGAAALWAMLFLVYAWVSILWSTGDKLWSTGLLMSFMVAFGLGTLMKSLKLVWIIWIAFVTVNIAVAFFIEVVPFGIFGNPNYLGCAIALAIASAIIYRLWWFIPIGISGFYVAPSRGAIMATGVIAIVAIWRYSRFIATLLILLMVPVLVSVKSGDVFPIAARLGVWQETLEHLTVFGSGFNSFFTTYQTWPRHINMTLTLPPHVYNDVLELIFEFGIGAIPLWIALILTFERSRADERLIALAFFALGITFFPLYIIPFGQLFLMTVGHLIKELPNEMASERPASYRRTSFARGYDHW